MKLFPAQIAAKLEENGKVSGGDLGHVPVVKIFGGSATWLITDSDPANPDILFGLCDLGMGFPEMGSVSRSELEGLKTPPFGLALERDLYFEGEYPLAVYADAARKVGTITEDAERLKEAAGTHGVTAWGASGE